MKRIKRKEKKGKEKKKKRKEKKRKRKEKEKKRKEKKKITCASIVLEATKVNSSTSSTIS